MRGYVVGIDLGTSVVKATLVQTDGGACAEGAHAGDLHAEGTGGMQVVCSASRTMPMMRLAPGMAEQDPDTYVAAALDALREVVEQVGVAAGDVAAIAFSGQMGGAMAVDRYGEALTPWYPSTLDARYQPYLQMVMHDASEQVLALNGAVPILAPRIAWWRAEYPAIYQRIDKVLLLANYVAARLGDLSGDAICCDPSYLTWTGLADTRRRMWSPQLAELWDVPLARLPRLVASATVVGALGQSAAAHCGLHAGTPLVAGAGDQVAGFLGAGLVKPGQLIDVAGTFPVFATCLDRCLVDVEQGILQPLAGPLGEDHWYAMMYIGGGGLTHHWFVEQLAQELAPELAEQPAQGRTPNWQSAYALLDEEAAHLPPGAQGLLFIPHLLGRACPPDPSVRGAWLGLTWTHTRAHLYRALLEAIAYDYAQALAVLRSRCPELDLGTVRVIGGGAASGVWNQIKADVLGLPYARLGAGDRAALGCAILAGHAAGIFPDMAAAAAHLAQLQPPVHPRPAWHAHYRNYIDAYRRAYAQLHDLYASLAALNAAPWPPPPSPGP